MVMDRSVNTKALKIQGHWIVSPGYDLIWFFGASLLGYVVLWFHLGLGISGLILWWAWVLSVDSPHLFATYWLTYLNQRFRGENRLLLIGSLIWIAFPVALAVLGSITGFETPFKIYLLFVFLYGWWHILRQHYGFVVLYQIKSGEKIGVKSSVDFYFIHISLIIAFGSFLLQNYSVGNLIFSDNGGSLINRFGLFGLNTALLSLWWVLVIGYSINQIRKYFQGQSESPPKIAYLALITVFYGVVYLVPEFAKNISFLAIPPIITVFHNVQYHALVWHLGPGKFTEQPGGLGKLIGRSFLTYAAAALVFTAIYRGGIFGVRGFLDFFEFGPMSFWRRFFVAVAFGIATHHYYLAQKIWRARSSPRRSVSLA